jgi:hypothetical protein
MSLEPPALAPRPGPGRGQDPDCSVIIVNYHSEAALRGCLESLPASAHPLALEVIVVDNSGTARASGALDLFPGVRLLETGVNCGFARACNLGMAAARGRHLLLLNPDTVAHPGAVATLAGHLDAHPRVGVAAARLLDPDGTLQYSCRRFPRPLSMFFGRYALLTRLLPGNRFSREYLYLDFDHAAAREVDWVAGACLMARREVLARVGPLDDGYFLFVEDMDWCRRIRDARYAVVYVPEAVVTHRIGVSRGPAPARVVWERHRSMLRYVHKHFTWSWPLVALAGGGLMARAAILVLAGWLRPQAATRRGQAPAAAGSPAPVGLEPTALRTAGPSA